MPTEMRGEIQVTYTNNRDFVIGDRANAEKWIEFNKKYGPGLVVYPYPNK